MTELTMNAPMKNAQETPNPKDPCVSTRKGMVNKTTSGTEYVKFIPGMWTYFPNKAVPSTTQAPENATNKNMLTDSDPDTSEW